MYIVLGRRPPAPTEGRLTDRSHLQGAPEVRADIASMPDCSVPEIVWSAGPTAHMGVNVDLRGALAH